MPAPFAQTPLHALRESLRADTPAREASIAKLLAGSCAIAIPFIFAANGGQGVDLPHGDQRGSNRVFMLPITTTDGMHLRLVHRDVNLPTSCRRELAR